MITRFHIKRDNSIFFTCMTNLSCSVFLVLCRYRYNKSFVSILYLICFKSERKVGVGDLMTEFYLLRNENGSDFQGRGGK